MRALLIGLMAVLPLAGCAGLAQNVYDERAERECEQIIDVDQRRACLNALEDERRGRD